jgi:hypothetical protein
MRSLLDPPLSALGETDLMEPMILRLQKLILMSLMVSSAWAGLPAEQPVTLKPSMEQRFASNLATKFLTNWHYKDTRLDDELSSDILDGYLKLLDPNRSYFLAADLRLTSHSSSDSGAAWTTPSGTPTLHRPSRSSICTAIA